MEDITVKELLQKKEKGENLQLLDVREAHEREAYNIGGTFLPLGELTNKISELPFDKDQEVIVYCRSGNRSGVAKEILQRQGYSKARNLLGGMIAWSDLKEKS
jgi:rhodanese-related sulfurtransferase